MSDIWKRLENFEVGQGNPEFSFLDRLARENRWTSDYTRRVYREYLRFIALAVSVPGAVTPSDEVDQVWHLHLCYSDSYWRDMCHDILSQDLHHGPTRGGRVEDHRYREQYVYTLEQYELMFGEVPPRDIWPIAEKRFDPGQRFVRVNLKDSLVIEKRGLYQGLAISGLAMALTGCTQAEFEEALGIGVFIFLVVLLLKIFYGRGGRGGCGGGGGGCGGGGCGGGGCGGG